MGLGIFGPGHRDRARFGRTAARRRGGGGNDGRRRRSCRGGRRGGGRRCSLGRARRRGTAFRQHLGGGRARRSWQSGQSAGPPAPAAEHAPRGDRFGEPANPSQRRRARVGAASPSALAAHPRRRGRDPRRPLRRSRRWRRQSQSRPRRINVIFRRAQLRYSQTPQPVTPYQAAAQAWDERIGSARVQAHHWRLAAFGCLALALVATGALVWRTGQSLVTPYVVEVDKAGEVRAVGEATTPYRPTDAQIAFHLAHFISNVRSLGDRSGDRASKLARCVSVHDGPRRCDAQRLRPSERPICARGPGVRLGRDHERRARERRLVSGSLGRAQLQPRCARHDRTLDGHPLARHRAPANRRANSQEPVGHLRQRLELEQRARDHPNHQGT